MPRVRKFQGHELSQLLYGTGVRIGTRTRAGSAIGTGAAPAPEVQAPSVRGDGQVRSRFMSSIEYKANFLANVQLFKHLSREVLQKLASRIHLVALPTGHVIKENEPADGLYIIKSGMA